MVIVDDLNQGSPNYSLWSKSSPRSHFTWPQTFCQ